MARNGSDFEARIRQNELGNPKFNFLNNSDPYHGYYQHKVSEFRDGKGKFCDDLFGRECAHYKYSSTIAQDSVSSLPAGIQKMQVTSAAHQKQQELLKQVTEQTFVPKDPPPEFEFVADPPSISALDLYAIIPTLYTFSAFLIAFGFKFPATSSNSPPNLSRATAANSSPI